MQNKERAYKKVHENIAFDSVMVRILRNQPSRIFSSSHNLPTH
jgi:hypothetical protein